MAGYYLSDTPPQDPTNPFGNLLSLTGTGVGIYNQQQQYQGLQDALKTVGPTNLNSWGLNGPGGMSTGYNTATGQGNINLGGLNPAFSGFSSAAGAGANGYNAGLPYGLSSNASQFLPAANNQLFGAYGNYGQGIGAANSQLPTASGANFNSTLNNLYGAYQQQLQPQIQQQAYGLQNTLFGNGVANSTGAASGSLAAQNFGRGVAQADANAFTQAFQGALGQQTAAAQNYGTLSNSANGILNNALANFGNTNQLISGLNTAGLTNAGTAAQGAGALNTLGLNNYNASLQTGVGQGTVRNQSLFPYASLATAAYGKPSGLGTFANALTQAGANGQGGAGGSNPIGSLFNYGRQAYNWMTGGAGVPGGGIDPSQAGSFFGFDANSPANFGFDSSDATASNLSGFDPSSFSPASGGAADSGNGLLTGGLRAPFGSAEGALAPAASAADPAMAGLAGVPGIGSSDAAATMASGFDPATASFGGDAAMGGMAGAAAAAALPLGLIAFASQTPPWTYNSDHNSAMMTGVTAGLQAMGSHGIGAATGALGTLKANPSLITPQLTQQYGITPQNIDALYTQSLHTAPTYAGGTSQGRKL